MLSGICTESSPSTSFRASLWRSISEYSEKTSLHRFNDAMAEIFYKAVWRIKTKYGGDASRIWSNNPSSAAVVYRFLQFDGVGVKIATMAANILARQFKVPFSDYYSIDISPDVHVFRVFRRTGLTEPDATRDAVIYKARELCPEFPGITDAACWRIGRGFAMLPLPTASIALSPSSARN